MRQRDCNVVVVVTCPSKNVSARGATATMAMLTVRVVHISAVALYSEGTTRQEQYAKAYVRNEVMK